METGNLLYRLQRILSWEKKKAVLPVMMCIILVSAVFGIYHVRGSNYDKQGIEASVSIMGAATKYNLLNSYYNGSVKSTVFQEELKALKQNAREKNLMKREDFLASTAPLFAVYRTPFFLLEPSDSIILGDGSASVFSPSNGYYLSEEGPEAIVELQYTQLKTQEIKQDIVGQNLSVFEVIGRLEEIRNQSIKEKAMYILEREDQDVESSGIGGFTSNFDGSAGLTPERVYSQVAEGEIKEVQWYHFIPALVSTFTVYYILSAFLVACIRRVRA